jgi:hypothetical protein
MRARVCVCVYVCICIQEVLITRYLEGPRQIILGQFSSTDDEYEVNCYGHEGSYPARPVTLVSFIRHLFVGRVMDSYD